MTGNEVKSEQISNKPVTDNKSGVNNTNNDKNTDNDSNNHGNSSGNNSNTRDTTDATDNNNIYNNSATAKDIIWIMDCSRSRAID